MCDTVDLELEMILVKNDYNNLQMIVSFDVIYEKENISMETWIKVTCWEGEGIYI